jgi:hypothetical protein
LKERAWAASEWCEASSRIHGDLKVSDNHRHPDCLANVVGNTGTVGANLNRQHLTRLISDA